MKARINSTNALVLSSSAKEVVSSWKSTVRVRFWCVALAALPMCHLHLIRPRQRMRYDEDNALKDQGNRQGFTAALLNAMECGLGLLTGCRVRLITFPWLWRPASAGNW